MRHTSISAAALATSASAFFLFALAACGGKPSKEIVLIPVRVATVENITDGNTVRYSANIVPATQVEVSFKSNGYLRQIRTVQGADGKMRKLEEGDWVKQGTVLAEVDSQDYSDKLKQAQAQQDRAKAELERSSQQFERTAKLFATGSATRPDYDRDKEQFESAKAAIKNAEAQLSEATIALGYCSLRAPFDGWIVKRNVDIGALVGPTTQGFTMSNTELVKAVFGVPDTAIQRVHLGQAHAITTDSFPEGFSGRVTAISPAADPKSRVYSVEVTIPNSKYRLKSGMIASITFTDEKAPPSSLGVPLESIVRDPQRTSGFAVVIASGAGDTASAEIRPVELGDAYGNAVAIKNGVQRGERVVTRGSTLLKSGDPIRIVQ